MVSFGSQLRLARRPGWEEAYFNYEALKLLLTQIEAVYEEEAHLQQRRREGRDLDVMFIETPPSFTSTGDRPPADATDYRDELFIQSDSDAAFESLMKYDYYSAEEEASDLEQQQHQLEMEQAAMMHPNASPISNKATIGGSASTDMQSIFSDRESRPDILTAASSTSTSALPFSLMGSYSHGPSTRVYHDFHEYSAEDFTDFEDDDSQDGKHNCVPSTWSVGRSQQKKTRRQPKKHRGKARGTQFLSPTRESDFYVHHNHPTTDAFILDASATDNQLNEEENETRQRPQDMDGSILKKPFRSTLNSEKTSLLSVPATPATGSSLFSFASQANPVTLTPPPPGDRFISSNVQGRPARSLQMPTINSLSNANSTMSSSFHSKNKVKLVQKLEKERKDERRKRRQKRRQRTEDRKKLERQVPPHIRMAHTKAREITERFLGLLRAECEKVMLFAQSRLGELADTAGSLRFPAMEDQHTSNAAAFYPSTIASQQSDSAPMSPRTQGSYADYPLSDGGMHSSASSTSQDHGNGRGESLYWSDSSGDSARSRESGSPRVPRSLSAYRETMQRKKRGEESKVDGNKQSQREASSKRKKGNKHDGFDSAKRHLDHFEKLRRSRPIFARSGNVMGEDLLLLSAVDEADGFTAVGVELMHVLRYVCVNLIAVRKICRKHDRLLMNRMLGGYYHHLKMLAVAEANGKWKDGANKVQSNQQRPHLQSFQDEHVQNAQTLGGLLARESDDIFEPNHPAVIGQTNNNHRLVGLYDTNLQQLANSRTVQVISSCLVLALSEYEVSRSRANALASTGSGLPAPQRGSGCHTVFRHKQQQDQMSVLTGSDSHQPGSTLMFPLEEAEENDPMDSDGEGGPPSTASSISLTRLRFTVTSIIALREAARRKQYIYSTYLSRSMLAFTGRAVAGEGLDGCSRETLAFLVSYNPDAALLMDPASLNGGLKEGNWSKRSISSVMASCLAVGSIKSTETSYATTSTSLHQQEQAVIEAVNVLPKAKLFEVPDLFKSQRAKKSRSPAMFEDDSFRLILRLNRTAHLLYNMNYYVVHPTTITFVSAIGSPGAHSALIIGAPSLAALLSALLHCYVLSGDSKEPSSNVTSLRWLFLLAAVFGIVGNVVHVYGARTGSISFSILGRFIVGFSCSEIIHRNIVASLLPHNRIVFETAMLVQTQVLGFLLGMMLGTLAEFLPYHMRGWGIRSLSSSSWLMAFLWFLQLGAVGIFFKVEDGDAKERMESNNSAEVEQLLAKYKPTTTTQHDSDSSGSGHGGKGNDSSIIRTSLQRTYGGIDENPPVQVVGSVIEVSLAHERKKKGRTRRRGKRRMRTLKSFPSRLRRLLSYNVGVPVCLFMLLFIKFAHEVLISSCPMILNRYFRWGGGRAGIFLSALSITILPLHFVCGHLARKYEERVVAKKSLVVLGIGLLIMVNYGSVLWLAFQLRDLLTETEERQRETKYDWLLGTIQYFVGFGVAFLGLTSLDSSTLSLLSKVSPPRIRSSSVALQLGTIVSFVTLIARVVADFQILVIGMSHRLINTDLINSLVLPLLIACFVCFHFVRKHFFFLM